MESANLRLVPNITLTHSGIAIVVYCEVAISHFHDVRMYSTVSRVCSMSQMMICHLGCQSRQCILYQTAKLSQLIERHALLFTLPIHVLFSHCDSHVVICPLSMPISKSKFIEKTPIKRSKLSKIKKCAYVRAFNCSSSHVIEASVAYEPISIRLSEPSVGQLDYYDYYRTIIEWTKHVTNFCWYRPIWSIDIVLHYSPFSHFRTCANKE